TPDHEEVFLALQPCDDVQPGFGDLQSETVAKQLVKLFDEEIAPLGVDFPHPSDVTQEKALGNKTRQCRLFYWRRVLIHRATDLDQRVDQGLRRNDLAETQ